MLEEKINSVNLEIEQAIVDGRRFRAFFLGVKMLWIRRVEVFSFIAKSLEEETENGES
jgi:hypothetical protein